MPLPLTLLPPPLSRISRGATLTGRRTLQNYHWWWRSFLTGGASTLYLFIYAIIFYFRRMEVDGGANLVLYAGYTLIVSIMYWLATGTTTP